MNANVQSALLDAANRLQDSLDNRTKIGLGDVVTFDWNDGYHDATVTQVHKDGTVDLLRPYVHISDVSYAGRLEGSSSVLAYLGFEQIPNINPTRLKLVRKGPTLR